MKRLDSRANDFLPQLARLRASADDDPQLQQRVTDIIQQVRTRGDNAVLELTARHDRHKAKTVAALEVPPARLQQAMANLPAALRADLQTAARRLRRYHEQQRQRLDDWKYTDDDGNQLGEKVAAVARAVVYAPGGKAAYPSSVLMGVVAAKTAGVDDVILTTPAPDGEVAEATLAAAAIAHADRVFLLGGAQAVAGFALGTETLPRADIIVGPGNAYVAEAKRQVFGLVGLDSLAGPSEVLIISDDSAPAAWVAADLAAQAEHDEMAQVLLVSTDAAHLNAVEQALTEMLPTLPRRAVVAASLASRGVLVHARDDDDCVRIADFVAAEHVQVMTKNADSMAAKIKNAGGLFVGAHSCVAFGDYLAGCNHVLPTAGTARFASPLGVGNFVKKTGFLRATSHGAAAMAATTARLAEAEGLSAHAASARLRAAK